MNKRQRAILLVEVAIAASIAATVYVVVKGFIDLWP